MLAPGSRVGPYEITAMLGAGGMGEVYRARDARLKRDVALKVLPPALAADPDRLARFRREAELLASLDHPHIAGIYGVEESDAVTALVLQLVEGETLADRIARGPVPTDEALRVAGQIANALAAAHAQGIVHRDLKPSNISLTAAGAVKVLDFGLAKLAETSGLGQASPLSPTMTSPAVMTGAGMLLGTAAYMSPEQAKGKAVDKRADVWAFGCVLYEMLTGTRLHQGESVSETVAAVLKEAPDLTRVPPHLRRLLRSCLHKDPERRLRDIADWHLLVDDADVVVRERMAPSRRALWIGAAAAMIVAAAALGAWLSRQPAGAPEEIRSQIPAPEGLTFNPGTQAAISPDGRWLAFPAVGPDKIPRMYVRSISSLEVKPLPGSEGIIALSPPPFWSHDSRYVVYAAGGKLKKSDVVGTPAQPIADVGIPFAQGGSWSESGTILYARNTGRIEQVPANGGTPLPVTEIAPNETAHRWPQFLPDGRRFLYQRVSSTPGQTGIYIGSLDVKPEDQSRRMLLPTDRHVMWTMSDVSGAAYLLVQRDDTLLAQPFDTNSATLSGTPILVASGVGAFAGATAGMWSVSRHGALVYRGGGTGLPSLTWRDMAAGGRVLETVGEPRLYVSPTLSPDATQVAYRLTDAQGNQDIYIYDLRQRTERRLTFDLGPDEMPVWSHDGSKVFFASRRGAARRDLYEKNADGSGEERLVFKSDQDKLPASASRDGKLLIFASEDPKTRSDLWMLRLDSREAAVVVNSQDQEDLGQLSPDGKWLAYVVLAEGVVNVWVRPAPTATSAHDGSKWLVAAGSHPRWSRDGKRLFYMTVNGELTSVDVEPGSILKTSPPRVLLTGLVPSPWSVHPTEGKLILAQPAQNSGAPPPFTLVLNWISKLER